MTLVMLGLYETIVARHDGEQGEDMVVVSRWDGYNDHNWSLAVETQKNLQMSLPAGERHYVCPMGVYTRHRIHILKIGD